MKEQHFLKVSITRDVPNTAEIHIEAPDDDMDEQSLQNFVRQAAKNALEDSDDFDGELRWEEDLSCSEGLTVRAMDKVIRLEPDPKGLGYDVKTYLEMAAKGEMDAEEFLRRTANMARFHGFEVDDCLIRDDILVTDDLASGKTGSTFVASLETVNFSFLATGATESMAQKALLDGLKTHAEQYRLRKAWRHGYLDDIRVVECPAGGCLRDMEAMPMDQRVAQSVDAAPTAQTKEMDKQTVSVPDGYNGHTVLMYADPIEEWSDGTVKLRCAVPGKEYMTRWIGKDQLSALLEAQRHEAAFRNADTNSEGLPNEAAAAESATTSESIAMATERMERAFHNGMLPQPSEGTVTGTVRALAKDANANAFALVEDVDGKAFAVPMDPMRTWALVVGETATFQAVDGVRHYDLARRLHASATPDSGLVPGGKTDFEP